ALIDAVARGDYESACKDFDDTMKKALPPAKAEQTWKSLTAKIGPFKKHTAVRTASFGKYRFVHVTCMFEKDTLEAKLVFAENNKVAGLSFQKKSSGEYKPPAYLKADSFEEKEVTVGKGEWALPATLSIPKGEGPFPAVVLVHGSGPQDRDESIGPN